MNVDDKEIYNDVTEPENHKTLTPNPWSNTPLSSSTPYNTPRIEEVPTVSNHMQYRAVFGPQAIQPKNLSFVSNDSTNYDSEMTLNSNRVNQGANLLNQSLNISGNYSSRRGSIKNQEYVNFLNEWKNLHFYNDPILNESSLNIVPEEIDQNNNNLQEENIKNYLNCLNKHQIFNKNHLGMKEDDQPLRNRSISFKSAADIKKIFGQGNIKEPRKRNYDFNLESRDYELYLEKIEYDERTTLMIKNIPNKYSKSMLMEEINRGHQEQYDFFYLPIDFTNRCNVGYAFINFLTPKNIKSFYQEFNGKKWAKFNSDKICILKYARIQGKKALIEHFQNSSVMRQPVPKNLILSFLRLLNLIKKDTKLKPVILAKELSSIQQLLEKQKEQLQ